MIKGECEDKTEKERKKEEEKKKKKMMMKKKRKRRKKILTMTHLVLLRKHGEALDVRRRLKLQNKNS